MDFVTHIFSSQGLRLLSSSSTEFSVCNRFRCEFGSQQLQCRSQRFKIARNEALRSGGAERQCTGNKMRYPFRYPPFRPWPQTSRRLAITSPNGNLLTSVLLSNEPLQSRYRVNIFGTFQEEFLFRPEGQSTGIPGISRALAICHWFLGSFSTARSLQGRGKGGRYELLLLGSFCRRALTTLTRKGLARHL